MKVTVEQLTPNTLVRELCSRTTGRPSKVDIQKLLDAGHSPVRGIAFKVDMIGIYSFVSTHLVRHKIGVEHFVYSLRDDRGGNGDAGRTSPVDHTMICNPESLVTMAHKRLCSNAHGQTIKVMRAIKKECPKWLQELMVPMCEYRGGFCHELKTCGLYPRNINFGAWKDE